MHQNAPLHRAKTPFASCRVPHLQRRITKMSKLQLRLQISAHRLIVIAATPSLSARAFVSQKMKRNRPPSQVHIKRASAAKQTSQLCWTPVTLALPAAPLRLWKGPRSEPTFWLIGGWCSPTSSCQHMCIVALLNRNTCIIGNEQQQIG